MENNMMNVGKIKNIAHIDNIISPINKSSSEKSFKDILVDFISDVNKLQNNADKSIQKLATGEIKDMHQVMLAIQEANVAFDFMMQTRNKLLDAYKEILRMG